MYELHADVLFPKIVREFAVVCFCAEWCGTCREYKEKFQGLEQYFSDMDFFWIDIESSASWLTNFDPEDFPTILIQRNEYVLFYGPMLPHEQLLHRLLDMFNTQTLEQSAAYANHEERHHWQREYDFRTALKHISE